MTIHRKWLLAICALMLGGLTVWAATERMSVQVRQGQIRRTPSFLGQVVRVLSYGDQVQVMAAQQPWFQVQETSGSNGWMHASALTRKRIVFRRTGDTARTAASSEELALAGKGFNEDVEHQFKSRNPNLSFLWVDRMEKLTISPAEMEAFLTRGGVRPAGGGAS